MAELARDDAGLSDSYSPEGLTPLAPATHFGREGPSSFYWRTGLIETASFPRSRGGVQRG